MAAIANLTVNDGSATPVAVTFTAASRTNNEVMWEDRRLAASTLWPRLFLSFDRASKARKTNHVELRMEYPIVRTVDGVETVVDTARYERGRYILPISMTEQERKHLSAFVRNGLSATLIKNVAELLDWIL